MTPRVRVVTISREYGSGGAAIAAGVARKLGFQLLDRGLILSIARAGGIEPSLAVRFDETVDPWLHRLGRALWHGGFEAVSLVDETTVVDADRLAMLSQQVIEEAARLGECVIVGRGAQCVLRGRPDVLHAFVYAPRDQRIARLGARLAPGTDVESAIDETDRERAAYLQHNYARDWKDPQLYDLMVNSAVGETPGIEIILAALSTREKTA